jgi:hypothetical protein
MSRLARYEVGTTVLNLTPEDAEKLGAKPLEGKARAAAPNKARTSKAAGTKRSSTKR